MSLRMGELFAGYGGLGMGVKAALGDVDLAWVSDIDKGACKILAHRFPGVPNLGDITAVDWSQVEPVDVLTGGFPCQDVSAAGKRAGIRPGTRSGLWTHFAYAIDQLRPSLVVIENVRGLLSARAHSDVEPCAWCVGDDTDGALRALGAVLGDLASLGYDASWHGLRAADVGAPHGRFRVFVVAHPQHAQLERVGKLPRLRGRSDARLDVQLPGSADLDLLPTPVVNDMGEGKTVEAWDAWTDAMKAKHGGNGHGASLAIEAQRLLPTPTTQDAANTGGPSQGERNTVPLNALVSQLTEESHGNPAEGRPVPRVSDVRGAADAQEVRERSPGGQIGVPAAKALLEDVRQQSPGGATGQPSVAGAEDHTEGLMRGVRDDRAPARSPHRQEPGEQPPGQPHRPLCALSSTPALAGGPSDACGCGTQWGQYEAAIRRWERVLGRAAPCPTQPGARGGRRLDPRFSEFLMGLPAGWITDVPGVTRNEALKLAGNGVVPQQCEAAVRFLLAHIEAGAAA